MARRKTVIHSINSDDGHICVDVFEAPEGGFGFEEYRRDAEDPRGWFQIGQHGAQRFDTAEAALNAARATIGWLE